MYARNLDMPIRTRLWKKSYTVKLPIPSWPGVWPFFLHFCYKPNTTFSSTLHELGKVNWVSTNYESATSELLPDLLHKSFFDLRLIFINMARWTSASTSLDASQTDLCSAINSFWFFDSTYFKVEQINNIQLHFNFCGYSVSRWPYRPIHKLFAEVCQYRPRDFLRFSEDSIQLLQKFISATEYFSFQNYSSMTIVYISPKYAFSRFLIAPNPNQQDFLISWFWE